MFGLGDSLLILYTCTPVSSGTRRSSGGYLSCSCYCSYSAGVASFFATDFLFFLFAEWSFAGLGPFFTFFLRPLHNKQHTPAIGINNAKQTGAHRVTSKQIPRKTMHTTFNHQTPIGSPKKIRSYHG